MDPVLQRGAADIVDIGGRPVVAFVEISERGSNRIKTVEPIPVDGGTGHTFGKTNTGSVNVWGAGTDRGKRIADAYASGDLPTNDVEELNRVLRPDEFEEG